jgi:RNA polymerase sigma-70 factor (ECF subfamily)
LNLSAQDILFLQNRVAYVRDEQAYKKIFFHFHSSLYRFAFNIVHNEEVADEIVSDVMMKVWSLGNKLAQVDKLNLYLFASVKNAALTFLAKKKPEMVVLTEEIGETIASPTADKSDYRLLLSEIEQKVEAAVTGLPPQCQLVYRLIKEEGFSHKEVCAVLEVSQNTIETHMRIALKKIRLSLDSYLLSKK